MLLRFTVLLCLGVIINGAPLDDEKKIEKRQDLVTAETIPLAYALPYLGYGLYSGYSPYITYGAAYPYYGIPH